MVSYLISGATRGIGFALSERLAKKPSNIIYAGARDIASASALKELSEKTQGRVQIVQLDPTSDASVKAAVKTIEEQQGSTAKGGFADVLNVDLDALRSNFEINAVGVARLTNAALPLLRKSDVKQIFVISSSMGAIWEYLDRGMAMGTAYAPSKSAVNMLTAHFAIALKPEGFLVKALNPGWVKTDMGGEGADLTIDQSIVGLEKVLDSAKIDDNLFINYDGKPLPW